MKEFKNTNLINSNPIFNAQEHPPKQLYILTNSECNLRCKHCHVWLNKNGPDIMTTAEKLDLLKQFHALNPNGGVTFSGGEIMLDEDDYFALTGLCQKLKLSSASISNASKMNESNYEKILTQSSEILIISLDSHLESIHDYIRGIKGAYQHVVRVLKDLVNLRKTKFPNCKTKIYINKVLIDLNINLCHEYIAFAKELGIDGVMMQCLHKVPQKETKGIDSFFTKHFFHDKEEACNVMDEMILNYSDDKFVLTDKEEFRMMKSYIRNPDFLTSEQVCDSHEKNIMVDPYGNYQLCFLMHELNDVQPIGNIRNISMKDLWTSSLSNEARKVMNECRKDCGIFACHRKEKSFISI